MDFKKDISDYIKGELGYFNITYSPSADLDSDLLKLFTIQKKFVYQFNRKVEISKELHFKIENNHKHKNEILKLKECLEKGIDINPNQTKNLFNYHVHDDLVYDWKIYHFHLTFEREYDSYFTKRTKEVLFAYITKDRALLLDVIKHPPHDIFANKILLEIIDRNWDGILLEANGVQGLSHNPSTKERFQLRKYNLNEGIIEVNGKFIFSPGLGQVSSGHSAEEVMKLNQLNRWLKTNEKAILQNKDTIDIMFMKSHSLRTKPEYEIVFTDQGPQIWDRNTKTCLVKYNEIISMNESTNR
ncbi:hypothetical protein [Flavobacterium filum]|uniref:hypothetical protein n=1 Tax=Flavobacterium filum TaxID=370974 RepID=UPI0023F19378|nr:hypothetical protein [Flavobacterium filum]